MFVDSRNALEVSTHEIRFATDQSRRWRVQGGVFMSELELRELNDFTYPGSLQAVAWDGVTRGYSPNYPLTNPQAAPGHQTLSQAEAGYYTYPGPFPRDVVFRNDIRRTDDQFGVFAELGIDLSDEFALTVGARNYEIEVDFEGSANSSFYNFGQAEDQQRAGANLSAQFRPGNTFGAPDKAVADGTIFKATLDWRPQPAQLYYVTLSEGFRPGLLNRPGGRTNSAGTFTVPWQLETDEVTNFELGVKSDFGAAFRLNAALFSIAIDNLQTTIFDPEIVNLFFSDNAADAKVTGLEADFTWLPAWSDRLTVAGAVSFLNSEITRVITPTNDVRLGDELAFAPGVQGNLRARYEWNVQANGWTAHVMPMISWSAESYSDIVTINRDLIDGWTMLGLTMGVTNDDWSAELYINNLTDERAEVSRSFGFDNQHVTYAPPRTIGVRAGVNF